MNEYANAMEQMELEYLDRNDECGGIEYTLDEYEDSIRREEAEFEAHNPFNVDTPNYDEYLNSICNKPKVRKNENIDWNEDIIVPTHNTIRNNNIEEKGRGRQRNRNDVYKNTTIGLVMGYVGDRNEGEDMYKYLYEKDIESRLEELKSQGVNKVPSKKRIIKDFMQINSQLGADFIDIINTRENGLCYIIKQSVGNKYFTTIPLYKWKELANNTNKEMMRLFATISMHKDISTNTSVIMTREYLCKCMNIEPTLGNKNYISEATNSLFKLGLVDIETEDRIELVDGKRVSKTYNWFRLTTYDEWKEKGKKKKKKR